MGIKQWQAEQLKYPLDEDCYGESSHIFDLEAAAEQIVGKLNGGDTFIYLFRRFGYPRFGWDGRKQLVLYRITTPMEGVILMVEPDVTGAFTFAYMMLKDIAEAYAEEDRKPFTERYERFEAWTIAEKGIETMHIYLEPDNEKLQRVWQTWAAANKDNDFKDREEAQRAFIDEQAKITQDLLDEYLKIEPYAKSIPLEDRPDDSIMKRVHVALCDTIRDLLRPVYVRDVMLNIKGEVVWDEVLNQDRDAVKCTPEAGWGVGGKLDDSESEGDTMTADIRQSLMKHVTIRRLKDYLDHKWWSEEPFGRDTVLKFISPSNPDFDILIPSKRELVDYDRAVEIAIEGISAYELRDFDIILSEILPCSIVEQAEIRALISECERLIPRHRDDFALTQSLKSLRAREQNLTDEIMGDCDE